MCKHSHIIWSTLAGIIFIVLTGLGLYHHQMYVGALGILILHILLSYSLQASDIPPWDDSTCALCIIVNTGISSIACFSLTLYLLSTEKKEIMVTNISMVVMFCHLILDVVFYFAGPYNERERVTYEEII